MSVLRFSIASVISTKAMKATISHAMLKSHKFFPLAV
jgi:hypothetical protein